MALFKDFKIKTSPQAVNLVSNIMDAQGLHSNTSDGINKLLSMIDKHPSAGSRGWLEKNQKGEYEESNPGINNLHYDPTYHNHPVVEEVTRKRIIDHLDNLTKPNELYLHLGKINKVLGTSYRDSTPFQKASAHSYALGEKIPEVASTHTVLPRDEQTKLLDGITRLITHPHFADGIAQHGPSYLGKRLSNKNNMIGFSQARFNNSENPVDYDHHKLFSRLITHDDLRNQLHDTLDKIETRSPAHKQLAAAIRGHMLSFSLINPKELTRLTKKFMSDTDSIDVGRYGLYGKRKNEFIGDKASDGYEYHTPEEMEQINKKNDQKT
jgi:hypothetical protein